MTMGIILDDAGDVPEAAIAALNLYIVPIILIFGTEQYRTRVDINRGTFYEKVRVAGGVAFPTTSQPTPYQFEEVCRQALSDGVDELLLITVSKVLSGTYDSAVAAAHTLVAQGLVDQERIHVFDSQSGSAGQGFLALAAGRLAEQGAAAETILEALRFMRAGTSIFLLIESLEFAVRSGRVSSLRSGVASLLNIKPVMTVVDGLIVPATRVRTSRKAREYIVNATAMAAGDEPVYLAAVHANEAAAGAELLALALPRLQVAESYLLELALSVAVHLGPGAIGLVVAPQPSRLR